MTDDASTLGTCPFCDRAIPRAALLIRYERMDWPAMFADCPHCRNVVRPR